MEKASVYFQPTPLPQLRDAFKFKYWHERLTLGD